MGIYDRDYIREDRTGWTGWPFAGGACQTVVVATVAVFVVQLATLPKGVAGLSDLGWFTQALELNPQRVWAGEVWRLLTGAFLHSPRDWMHILFNMLALYWLGREVEQIYGSREFLAFYLVAALFGSVGYMVNAAVTQTSHPALGASGAVTAVMVLFAMHYPYRTFLLFFVIPVPAYICVALFVLFDTFGLFGGRPGVSIGFAAHLGGAAFGFLYYKSGMRLMNWWPSRMSMRPGKFKPRLRVYTEEPDGPPTPPSPAPERPELLEEQLDAVLAKVAKFGKDSLTERERQILQRASEVYKQRRK